MMFGRFTEEEVLAFLSRLREVEPPAHVHGRVLGPCRVWVGALTADGYANLVWHGQNLYGHKVALEIVTGRYPTGTVLHACDNRPCCNHDHLSEADAKANFDDMRSKGRDVPPPHPCGADHPESKLSSSDIAHLWTMVEHGYTQQEIADALHVSQPLVSGIVNGKARTCR